MSKFKHYLLYGHGGSYNHGSEASVKCDIELLRRVSPGCKITLSSHFPDQDIQFGVDADEIVGRDLDGKSNAEIYADTISKITPETICLSVGGDTYCYPNWQRYATIHKAAKNIGANSILWSCSLEPSMIDEDMFEVLRTHDLIAARESITAYNLKKLGLKNVALVSDIAFDLKPQKTIIPDHKYVSINLSPLVIRRNSMVLEAYQMLVNEILDKTDYDIAFVPHVEVYVDNDKDALDRLQGDESRIFRVPTGLCAAQYKYIVGNSDICVASRTHTTIAAWSSIVPTIAIGYSTKAAGISMDLCQEEYYVSIDTMNCESLCSMFFKILHNIDIVREKLRTCLEKIHYNSELNNIIRKVL